MPIIESYSISVEPDTHYFHLDLKLIYKDDFRKREIDALIGKEIDFIPSEYNVDYDKLFWEIIKIHPHCSQEQLFKYAFNLGYATKRLKNDN